MSATTETLASFKVVDTTDPEHFFNAALSFRPRLRGFFPFAAENGWRASLTLIHCGEVRI